MDDREAPVDANADSAVRHRRPDVDPEATYKLQAQLSVIVVV